MFLILVGTALMVAVLVSVAMPPANILETADTDATALIEAVA